MLCKRDTFASVTAFWISASRAARWEADRTGVVGAVCVPLAGLFSTRLCLNVAEVPFAEPDTGGGLGVRGRFWTRIGVAGERA